METTYFICWPEKNQVVWRNRLTWEEAQAKKWEGKVTSQNLHRHINLVYCNTTKELPANITCQSEVQHLGMLKSLFQKCVRRQEHHIGLQCAKAFFTLNPKSFLRRLIIIMCEDVYPEPLLLNITVWLQLAYEAKPNPVPIFPRIINLLFTRISALILEKNYIKYGKASMPPVICVYAKMLDEMNRPISREILQMALSFQVYFARTQFTLHGDQKMMNWWQHHVLTLQELPSAYQEVFPIDFGQIPVFQKEQYLLEGIDFHNFPQIIQQINTYVPATSSNDIRKTIWHFRSGINFRKDNYLPKELSPIWQQIRAPLDRICRNILNQHQHHEASGV